MAISSVVKNYRDGTLTFSDATTPTPLSMTVQYESGDFSLSGLGTLRETTTYLDRGEFGSLRNTARSFPSGSFSAHFTDLTDATGGTLYDVATISGYFASMVSTLGIASDVKTYKLVWTCEGSNFGDSGDHVLTLNDVHVTGVDVAEGDPTSYTINFVVYGSITAV